MQPRPQPPPASRSRFLTLVLVGGVLLLVGNALGSTWTVAFALTYPNYYLGYAAWSALATAASLAGRAFYVAGLFVMLYGIARGVRFRERGLGREGAPTGAPDAASRPPNAFALGRSVSAASMVVLGAILIVAGQIVSILASLVTALVVSFDAIRIDLLGGVLGGMINAFGMVLALYGVALFVYRPLSPSTSPHSAEPAQS